MLSLLENIISARGSLEGVGRQRNKDVLCVALWALVVGLCVLLPWFVGDSFALGHLGAVFILLCGTAILTLSCCGRVTSVFYIKAFIIIIFTSVLLVDMSYRAVGGVAWPLCLVIIDLSAGLNLGETLPLRLTYVGTVWLVVQLFERVFRFGLYEVPLLPSQETRYDAAMAKLQCKSLPCEDSAEWAVGVELAALSVFVLHFSSIRALANQARTERLLHEESMKALRKVANMLAEYEIDTALHALDGIELKHEMKLEFLRLEQNLRLYRPYLPHWILNKEGTPGGGEMDRKFSMNVAPPGVVAREATIVFTDVRKSTALWEQIPDAMERAIDIHNEALRYVASSYNGYEVKTIGDAFMVAFETPSAGINFALSCHEELLESEWPAGMQEVVMCRRDGEIWGGLTVRIGLNHGPVTLEENVLTGRTDYHGRTVNIAARLEGKCSPGAVALPTELWDQEEPVCLLSRSSPPVATILNGVSEPIMITLIWPIALAKRQGRPLKDVVASHAFGLSLHNPNTELRSTHATVGILQFCVQKEVTQAGASLNAGLESVAAFLSASGGTLVTVLGFRACVGWNITRQSGSHAECSLWFMQRLRVAKKCIVEAAGLSTGELWVGDMGTQTNRFMTVAGDPVDHSWELCSTALTTHCGCLYRPPPCSDLPSSLAALLRPAPLVNNPQEQSCDPVYELIDEVSPPASPYHSEGEEKGDEIR